MIERIYLIHQNSSRATWYRSRSGRLVHAIDDFDGLDILSIRMQGSVDRRTNGTCVLWIRITLSDIDLQHTGD